jgi:hypothetical protein
VLDVPAMERLGMWSLLSVGQGSIRPSRLIAMEWMGGAEGAAPLMLIGKGVTFDTGGISLKPAAGMEDMRNDMGGAGAVAGAMRAIAGRKAKANVVGVCGLVENMPSDRATRPGDVVTSMSGITVEIINTDAEGRLVLIDAMTWAQRTYKPDVMIDLATLTGAMVIAVAHEYGGMFANDDALAAQLTAAGLAVDDKVWRFPLSEVGGHYDKMIDSPLADMKNVGPREGGSITAAQFLQRVVENGVKWAHLDIAGAVSRPKEGSLHGKGATGFGVRLLDRFVRDTREGGSGLGRDRLLSLHPPAGGGGGRAARRQGARCRQARADGGRAGPARRAGPTAVDRHSRQLPRPWPGRRGGCRPAADPADRAGSAGRAAREWRTVPDAGLPAAARARGGVRADIPAVRGGEPGAGRCPGGVEGPCDACGNRPQLLAAEGGPMGKGSIAAALLTWALAASAAAQGVPDTAMLTAAEPERLVQVLNGMGTTASLGRDSDGNPKIEVGLGGWQTNIWFYDCEGGRNCLGIQFQVGMATTRKLSLEQVNRFNAGKRFQGLYLNDARDPIMFYDLTMVTPGVSAAVFRDTVAVFEFQVRELEKLVREAGNVLD